MEEGNPSSGARASWCSSKRGQGKISLDVQPEKLGVLHIPSLMISGLQKAHGSGPLEKSRVSSEWTRTWIVALPHLFGGWLISVPGCGLIDGRLAPSNAGRESLGLIVGFGDAWSLWEIDDNGEHKLSQDSAWNPSLSNILGT